MMTALPPALTKNIPTNLPKTCELSVIIPLANHETAWRDLLNQLFKLSNADANPFDFIDCIVVVNKAAQPLLADLTAYLQTLSASVNHTNEDAEQTQRMGVRLVVNTKTGRASHMNAGANAAIGTCLWFLHVDSVLAADNLSKLADALHADKNSLYFFKLAFLNDASPLMRFNEWGVMFRANWLKIPFGDQGFCLSAENFAALGGYDENVAYGEDHMLTWQARQYGVTLRLIDSTLATSARKYQQNGWLKTTMMHQYLWLKQAIPEWRKLRNMRH